MNHNIDPMKSHLTAERSIPSEWSVVPLGDTSFVTKLAGFEYTEHFDYSVGGEIIVVRAINVTNQGFDLSEVHTIPKFVSENLPRSSLHKNDLVLVYVGATIGKVTIVREDNRYHLGPNVAKISPNKDFIDPIFLLQQMQGLTFQYELKSLSGSTSQPALSMENLRKARLIIPPLLEQRKIAEILSTWDEAIMLTEALIAALGRRKQALMQVLLTGEVRFQEFEGEWEEVKLGALTTKVGSGITPKGGSEVYLDSGIPLIRSQNVLVGKLDLSDVVYISEEQHQRMQATQLNPLDVLLNITGASIGRCALVPNDFDEGNVNQHVCIIRVNSHLDASFLMEFLNSDFGQNQIWSFQAGGNRQGLNFEQIRAFAVPLPRRDEQQAIATVLNLSTDLMSGFEKYKDYLQMQKRGLMQQLLTGAVRV